MQACASEYIGFLTSVISSIVMDQDKRTMQVDDLQEALKSTGMDNVLPALQEYHKKYTMAKECRKKIKANKISSSNLAKECRKKIKANKISSTTSISCTSGSQSPIINYLKENKNAVSALR